MEQNEALLGQGPWGFLMPSLIPSGPPETHTANGKIVDRRNVVREVPCKDSWFPGLVISLYFPSVQQVAPPGKNHTWSSQGTAVGCSRQHKTASGDVTLGDMKPSQQAAIFCIVFKSEHTGFK